MIETGGCEVCEEEEKGKYEWPVMKIEALDVWHVFFSVICEGCN